MNKNFNKKIVVKFKGGMGNQMFQYALYKKLNHSKKRENVADLSWYKTNSVPFVLTDAFPNIKLSCECAEEIYEYFENKNKNRNLFQRVVQKIFPILRYRIIEQEDGIFQSSILSYQRGILEGYWQTEKYWEEIRKNVKKDFVFSDIYDDKLRLYTEMIEQENTVSVHIRRGDYLLPENQVLFGNICTLEYYKKAMAYINDIIVDAQFVIFTNDVEWARKEFVMQNIVFASDYVDGVIPDWCEMYMMSRCKHHIIANSTFSWWGAYLSKDPGGVVVAPASWIKGKNTKDIYCNNWIKV